MKRVLFHLSGAYTLFLLLLFTAGQCPAPMSSLFYMGAYLLPCAWLFACLLFHGQRPELGRPKHREALSFTLPLLCPTVALLMGLAALSQWGFSLVGVQPTPVAPLPVWEGLLIYVLLPTVTEELLFRLLPLALLLPYGKSEAVIISSLFFALMHTDFTALPYTLAAGVSFALADLALGSVLPSILLHATNNLCSFVLSLPATAPYLWPIAGGFGLLTVISVIVLYKKRAVYAEAFTLKKPSFCKQDFSFMLILPVLCAVFMATLRLM